MALTSLDTNILIYAFQAGDKQDRAFAVLNGNPMASVQLLNEYANVSRRKHKRAWVAITEDLAIVRVMLAEVRPLTEDDNRDALRIAARYQLNFYDALMLAVALSGGARTFYSEDMQHDMLIDGSLRIVNPFHPEDP